MGGNIFNSTKPIKKEHIKPTLLQFLKQFRGVFPKAEPFFREMKTLGSVGKKDYSGDIDLALAGTSFDNLEDWGLDREYVNKLFEGFKKRARTSTEEQLMKRAVIVAIAQKIQESNTDILVDIKGSASGALFLAFPQYDENGEEVGDNVQIDINVGDVDWLEFAYYSTTYTGNVKGLHRTQLMLAMFSNKGYTFSHNYGVKDKDTQEIVANNPQEAINLLNKEYNLKLDRATISDYHQLMEVLEKGLTPDELNNILDRFIKILDSTRADIPEDLQSYWIKNQERLGLKGKFLPDNSNLVKYKKV
jgi:hypothetical protein